jgi:hypothetical protein
MANTMFGFGREGFLLAEIDWNTAVIKVGAVRGTAPGANIDVWKFVSDFTGGGGVIHGTPVALASAVGPLGVADAADSVFTALAANAGSHNLILFQSSAVGGGSDVAASAQRLIGYMDTGTNIPFVPNGGDVNVAWDNGANKIFKL